MLKKIKNFLFVNYHRPSAKLEHILVLMKKIFYNKKTKIFSERIFLQKKPPESIIFYNFFGRIIIYSINFIFIILFNKFYSSQTFLDEIDENGVYKKNFLLAEGQDDVPWPYQSINQNEIKHDHIENIFFKKILDQYNEFCIKFESSNFKESNWWLDCRKEFNKIFIDENKLKKNSLNFFRNSKKTMAEILSDQNFLQSSKYNKINMIRALSLINLYHKLSEHIDIDILFKASDSKAGKNICLNYRGLRINYRVLRYAYYASQIRKYSGLDRYKKNIFIDIGGGYGGLARFLKNLYPNSTFIIVELPELNLLSNYFLKTSFPDKKIVTDFEIDIAEENELKDNDFILMCPSSLKKLKSNSVDLAINTTSLGEMTDDMQNYYIQNIERTSKGFYSVNRAKIRKEKYNSRGFYSFNFKKKWNILLYKFTHTYHIEFFGENEDLKKILKNEK